MIFFIKLFFIITHRLEIARLERQLELRIVELRTTKIYYARSAAAAKSAAAVVNSTETPFIGE